MYFTSRPCCVRRLSSGESSPLPLLLLFLPLLPPFYSSPRLSDLSSWNILPSTPGTSILSKKNFSENAISDQSTRTWNSIYDNLLNCIVNIMSVMVIQKSQSFRNLMCTWKFFFFLEEGKSLWKCNPFGYLALSRWGCRLNSKYIFFSFMLTINSWGRYQTIFCGENVMRSCSFIEKNGHRRFLNIFT